MRKNLTQIPPTWQEILDYFRGSTLQNYFKNILENKLKSIIKPQFIDQIPKILKVSFSKKRISIFKTFINQIKKGEVQQHLEIRNESDNEYLEKIYDQFGKSKDFY